MPTLACVMPILPHLHTLASEPTGTRAVFDNVVDIIEAVNDVRSRRVAQRAHRLRAPTAPPRTHRADDRNRSALHGILDPPCSSTRHRSREPPLRPPRQGPHRRERPQPSAGLHGAASHVAT
ncbi:hypothetical protein FA95DRAFT_1614088 [Auriscalpium vulgare]|uniref:Uncharacterized protein n=1 Tax=Auriscalpium vulgare TaxID=40419 RepID=A0ACB8R1A7_9AGAM|nr:hypothetical protein FA95DRAFT_1614088 [Auriscalpium vulgare]